MSRSSDQVAIDMFAQVIFNLVSVSILWQICQMADDKKFFFNQTFDHLTYRGSLDWIFWASEKEDFWSGD